MVVVLDISFFGILTSYPTPRGWWQTWFIFASHRDKEPTTHSLKYVTSLCLSDKRHLLANFEIWLKDMILEQRSWLKLTDPLFVNWHCVECFDITSVVAVSCFLMYLNGWNVRSILFCHSCRLLPSLRTLPILFYPMVAIFSFLGSCCRAFRPPFHIVRSFCVIWWIMYHQWQLLRHRGSLSRRLSSSFITGCFRSCATCWFFVIVRSCNFDIPHGYQAFNRSVEVSWNTNGNVWWFS